MNLRILSFYGVAGLAICSALFSCSKKVGGPEGTDGGKVVYVISNDYHDNANAVLAYRRKADGTLAPLPGSPFLTHGAGLANPKQVLGPDDTDDPLVISEDGRFLFAVNGGSNTIAVFSINPDGSLVPVPGSPFPSGGQTPCSVAINGRFVYIANKAFDPLHPITQLPNYTAFEVNDAGQLSPVPNGTIEVPAGSSPSQVLLSNDRRFLFATDFLAFMLPSEEPIGTLLSFDVRGEHGLVLAPGAPYVVPTGDGGALGLATNPRSDRTLYVGFPVGGKFGVYGIDEATGGLNFETQVAAGPGVCWIRTNSSGNRLYTLNSGQNSVGVYNTDDPDLPAPINTLTLKDSKNSGDFSLGFSPDGGSLYVVSQNTDTTFVANNNWLHVLKVAADGTVSEPGEPLQLPVPNDVRPQGVATR
ncbi:MAG TPA: beta-propeller fold lactonase family protein [Puia sp.]|jgi:6-phosphogluconolactonase (cycloisomerase 2 family)|nr:beta-propeller fold lactonase family protein [Puia sp.]